jgi:hypothetical protein
MGLKILTVKSKNSDTAYAGSVLFNANRIGNMKLYSDDDSYFDYFENSNDVVFDKYIVNETLSTADDVFTAANTPFYTLPVYDNVNDNTSSTTNKPILADHIAKGAKQSSATTNSFLWIQNGGKVDKILVNKVLEQIEDWIMTGATTTTTTTTTAA